MTELYDNIVAVILRIPKGKVATYGQIAGLAGKPRAARTVSYVLHSSSRKLKLPWQRVINSRGTISLPRGNGYERQKKLLLGEGIVFDSTDRIDLNKFGWQPPVPASRKKKKMILTPDERYLKQAKKSRLK